MILGRYLETAVGELYLAVEGGYVVRLSGEKAAKGDIVVDGIAGAGGYIEPVRTSMELLDRLAAEVTEYLAGQRREFDLPVQVSGTAFQEKVWEALGRIPYGETRSYGEIAREVGSPGGARAVGMACHNNPVMLLIPCHRVIGSTGKPVGFGGGIPMKEYLLGLERGTG